MPTDLDKIYGLVELTTILLSQFPGSRLPSGLLYSDHCDATLEFMATYKLITLENPDDKRSPAYLTKEGLMVMEKKGVRNYLIYKKSLEG